MMTDGDLISLCSAGHRHTLLSIAVAKRALTMPGISVNEQLRLLEQINGCACHEISPAMIELIEPASDVEIRMIEAAHSLDAGDAKLSPSFYVLAKSFRQFCRINSSYLAALRLGAPKFANAETSPGLEKNDPIGSPPVRFSDGAATQVSPKSEPRKFPPPADGPEKYRRIAGPQPWDHYETFFGGDDRAATR
jgi:hypothetical protein